jgi:hypothetical protein
VNFAGSTVIPSRLKSENRSLRELSARQAVNCPERPEPTVNLVKQGTDHIIGVLRSVRLCETTNPHLVEGLLANRPIERWLISSGINPR